MAEVQLAMRKEGTFARMFAIKRLLPHLREEDDVRSMFLDEARIAGLLAHPNLVSVVDVGQDDAGPFLVMDYVEGVSVAEVIQRAIERAMDIPLALAVEIGRQAADGLYAAHSAKSLDGQSLGVVHRDVSPHNILVGFDGVARVTDFGIARAVGRTQKTSTGILKGKLGYMSPEQLSFQGQTQASDLFSFGVTLFELLTAERLYPSREGEKSARRILHEPPPDIADYRDDVPPELAELLFRLLAKQPEQRPASAREISQVLRAIGDELRELHGEFDVGAYLQREFAEERTRARQELDCALATLEGEELSVTAPRSGERTDHVAVSRDEETRIGAVSAQSRRAGRPFVLSIVLVVVAGTGFAWWQAERGSTELEAERPPVALSGATDGPASTPPASESTENGGSLAPTRAVSSETQGKPPAPTRTEADEPAKAASTKSEGRTATPRPSQRKDTGKSRRDADPVEIWGWE